MPNQKLQLVIKLGKQTGRVTMGSISLWTGLSPSTAYLLWLQIKDLCREGMLDDNEYYCIENVKYIEFKKREVNKNEQ